jgi:protein-tyrosine phosphatase
VIDEEEQDAGTTEEKVAASQRWEPDLHWLTPHVAVGGCFPMERAEDLARDHRIRAVVDLRAEERDEEGALREAGIALLHLPTPDLAPASHAHLETGVAFVREHVERGEKVLIHCQHGIGRSALLALCVLVDQGREPLDALSHAKDVRSVISPSRSQYDGWAEWLRSRGISAPDYHSFGCVAYRHLANG